MTQGKEAGRVGGGVVPLFSCSDPNCRVECSYPADMLAVFEGQPICQGCYEDNPPFDPVDWAALPRFVPADKQLIAELLDALESHPGYSADVTFAQIWQWLAKRDAAIAKATGK